MSGETTLTIVGNLTADPELRFTPSGVAVASFTVASTPRRYNTQSAQWEDGDPLFLRCSIWRQAAENLAESLARGARVVVAASLKYATATVAKERCLDVATGCGGDVGVGGAPGDAPPTVGCVDGVGRVPQPWGHGHLLRAVRRPRRHRCVQPAADLLARPSPQLLKPRPHQATPGRIRRLGADRNRWWSAQ